MLARGINPVLIGLLSTFLGCCDSKTAIVDLKYKDAVPYLEEMGYRTTVVGKPGDRPRSVLKMDMDVFVGYPYIRIRNFPDAVHIIPTLEVFNDKSQTSVNLHDYLRHYAGDGCPYQVENLVPDTINVEMHSCHEQVASWKKKHWHRCSTSTEACEYYVKTPHGFQGREVMIFDMQTPVDCEKLHTHITIPPSAQPLLVYQLGVYPPILYTGRKFDLRINYVVYIIDGRMLLIRSPQGVVKVASETFTSGRSFNSRLTNVARAAHATHGGDKLATYQDLAIPFLDEVRMVEFLTALGVENGLHDMSKIWASWMLEADIVMEMMIQGARKTDYPIPSNGVLVLGSDFIPSQVTGNGNDLKFLEINSRPGLETAPPAVLANQVEMFYKYTEAIAKGTDVREVIPDHLRDTIVLNELVTPTERILDSLCYNS